MSRCEPIINAILYYNTSDGTIDPTFDPITCMPIFETTEQTIELSLEPDETEPGIKLNSGGVDEVDLRLSGRLVIPSTLPPEIQPGGKYKMEVEISEGYYRMGFFIVAPFMQSKLRRARSKWGDWIQGNWITADNRIVD